MELEKEKSRLLVVELKHDMRLKERLNVADLSDSVEARIRINMINKQLKTKKLK